MGIRNRVTDLKRKLELAFEKEGTKSYSQFGEDIIIGMIFYLLRQDVVSYLDIGANFPKHFSNTYFFYKKGNRGVCIEPDVELYNFYKQIRPQDKVYNIGIGTAEEDEVRQFFFYKGERKGLNTFLEERLAHNEVAGNAQPEKANVTLRNINRIIEENFSSPPDFLSIDIEGLDLQVLKTLDFTKNAPSVICCEITLLNEKNEVVINNELKEFILSKGYFEYASTFINSIFVLSKFEKQIRSVNSWY